MPRVSVIIPTWNGAELLRVALRSLEAQRWQDFEVIVIDNASADDTLAIMSREFPDARQIALPENRGFAAAVNAGIEAARGEIIVLLNNDTEADPGWLAALVAGLERHPDAGSCASKMLDFSDRSRIDAAGDQMALQATSIGRGERDGPEFSRERYVFSACAGAAAYRREVFEVIGGFDERFFAYLEDVDVGFRAQIAGYRCVYVPDAVIYHRGGATSDRISDIRAFWLIRNSLFLFFQNMPARVLRRHGWFMLIWPFADALLHRRSLVTAARGWLAFCRDLPEVVRRRRRAYALRAVTDDEMIRILSLPSSVSEPLRHDDRKAAPVVGRNE
jgi:GT2 family glycosyltransferase